MVMEIEIDLTRSAQKNADEYFSRAKKARKKREGARASIEELGKKLKKARGAGAAETKTIRKIEKREWYEKFHWFLTSNNMLAIGGRDAQQNETINSKHFGEQDLFFHADVVGGSVVVLVNGTYASGEIKEEVAQFAACYSSAWKRGSSAVDVYAMLRDQVSKSSSGGYLGKGSFALSGEREWFRGVRLELVAFLDKRAENKLSITPSISFGRMGVGRGVRITMGEKKKSDAAKSIAKRLEYADVDYIMQQLPSGSFALG